MKSVFYAWQAQHPGKANRFFIASALERAIKDLASEADPIELTLEQDARDSVGSPDISSIILDKIASCSIFVGDVTPVGQLINDKPTPNPNVMFELGYAWRTLTAARVLLVLNEAFGRPEDLPFDISKRSLIRYKFEPAGEEAPASERSALAKRFREAFRSMLRNEGLDALRTAGLRDSDIELFKLVYADMIASNRPIYDYAALRSAGAERSLSATQVDDATQIISDAGAWTADPVFGGQRFAFVSPTIPGMEWYLGAFDAEYAARREQIIRTLAERERGNSRLLAAELKHPVLVVEHVMRVLERSNLVRLAQDTAGVHVIEILPKFRRAMEA